jgi:polyhydroxyalkanoate synthesis regulator phasin
MRGEDRRDPGPRWGGPEQERMREMMQQGMREAQRRMEQSRDKVRELEERVKKLEAEIERMKST